MHWAVELKFDEKHERRVRDIAHSDAGWIPYDVKDSNKVFEICCVVMGRTGGIGEMSDGGESR